MLNQIHHGKTMLPIIVLLGNTNVSVLRTPAFKTKHKQCWSAWHGKKVKTEARQKHFKANAHLTVATLPYRFSTTSKRISVSDLPLCVCVETKAFFQPLYGLLVVRRPVEMKQQAHDFIAICFAWSWWRTSSPLTIQLPSDLFFLFSGWQTRHRTCSVLQRSDLHTLTTHLGAIVKS